MAEKVEGIGKLLVEQGDHLFAGVCRKVDLGGKRFLGGHNTVLLSFQGF
jgi:hypothetical protein